MTTFDHSSMMATIALDTDESETLEVSQSIDGVDLLVTKKVKDVRTCVTLSPDEAHALGTALIAAAVNVREVEEAEAKAGKATP